MELPAIAGGKKVRATMLPYGHQWIDGEDIKAITTVLKSDWITQGPKVEEFEKRVAEYCGAKFAVAVSSGTAALHAACAVAGISSGDEAITTPLTFAATANAVIYCGGKPILADIRADTLNLNPDEVRKHLSPRTKAILPVDFAGYPAELEEIMAIAQQKNLVVIEDAAHALGAAYKGRRIGSFADMTALSFHPVKHITTGEGGMVLTNSKEYYDRLKIFRHHGLSKNNPNVGPWYSVIDAPGYNLRLTDIQCALGLSQMDKLERFIERRRKIAAEYNKAFTGMSQLIIPVEKEDARVVYHIYVVQLRLEMLKVGRKEIFEALRAENIGVNVHYIPLNLHPYYQQKFGFKKGDYPVAENYYERAITLPIFPAMSDNDIRDVVKAVKKVITYYSRGDTEA